MSSRVAGGRTVSLMLCERQRPLLGDRLYTVSRKSPSNTMLLRSKYLRDSQYVQIHRNIFTDVNKQDLNHLETPLHLACRSEHLKAVEQLLRHGADSNAPNKSQQTPLHLACRVGNANIVELLLRYGADPGLPAHGQTSLHVALRPYNGDIFGQLARSERGQQVFLKRPRPKGVWLSGLLPKAARYGLEDACTVLIEQFGYDVNSKPGDHALEVAILGGHLELAWKFVRQWNTKINPVQVLECCYWYGVKSATPRHRSPTIIGHGYQ